MCAEIRRGVGKMEFHEVANRSITPLGSVYCIGKLNHAVKIGWSGDIYARLRQLQIGCPFLIEIIAFMPGSKYLERGLQAEFDDLRLQGEWFDDRDGIVSGTMMELSEYVSNAA